MNATITSEQLGVLEGNKVVSLYTLTNSHGAKTRIMNYGGIVQSLEVPDRNGIMGDVVLGFDSLESYVRDNSPYFGCIVGRYANRIAGGAFALNGKTFKLGQNNQDICLHGGLSGFDKVVWTPTPLMTAQGPALELRYLSRDGEEGFPGNLSVVALYTFTDDYALNLEFSAVTDQDTVVSLTNHSYFNLGCAGDVLNHVITVDSDSFTPIHPTYIPTGEIRSLAGTPLDFRTPTSIGARIQDNDPLLAVTGGYDHNYLRRRSSEGISRLARIEERSSGRVLEVYADTPGFQFYTGNFLAGGQPGKGGRVYSRRTGFCIEPQHFPDAPNQPSFPSAILKPGNTYRASMAFKFSVL